MDSKEKNCMLNILHGQQSASPVELKAKFITEDAVQQEMTKNLIEVLDEAWIKQELLKEGVDPERLDEFIEPVVSTVKRWWNMAKGLFKKEPIPSGKRKFPIMTPEAQGKVVGKTLDRVFSTLENDILFKISEGDLAPLLTAELKDYIDEKRNFVDGLRKQIAEIRKAFGKLYVLKDKLDAWARAKKIGNDKVVHTIVARLTKKVGGAVEVGVLKYSDAPEAIRRQLDLALTMRQVAVNVDEHKLPCGADGLSRSPELSGGVSVPDEKENRTGNMWMRLVDEFTAGIPMKYGGDLLGKDLRPQRVLVKITRVEQSGHTTYEFSGDYTLMLHPKPGRPKSVTVRAHFIDRVMFGRALGSTDHELKIVKFSFPLADKELAFKEPSYA